MSRNTQVVNVGGRNSVTDVESASFFRQTVDTGANGQLTITVDGLTSVESVSIQAFGSDYKAAAVPQSGNDVLVVMLNDSDNTPAASSTGLPGIAGVARGQ